jgi:transposase
MKKNYVFVGIDVSKATLDIYIHGYDHHFVIENTTQGFSAMLEQICTVAKCKSSYLFVCFEHTGKYSKLLSVFLHSQKIVFAMEPALQIKKSLGMTRGKNDKVDSKRIANYAFEKNDKISPTILPGEEIDKIKSLLSLRDKLIKHRTAYKNGLTDLNDCYKEGENEIIINIQERLIQSLDQEIDKIENKIENIISQDTKMSKNYNLMLSVIGIGKVNAYYILAYTANFTLFANARAFACYCGIAPFGYSSGTITGKTKVHHYANKKLKSLLDRAATSSIRAKGEMKMYYEKRVNELGKNKKSTINIIRNKILYRVFAIINRGTPYVDIYKYAA